MAAASESSKGGEYASAHAAHAVYVAHGKCQVPSAKCQVPSATATATGSCTCERRCVPPSPTHPPKRKRGTRAACGTQKRARFLNANAASGCSLRNPASLFVCVCAACSSDTNRRFAKIRSGVQICGISHRSAYAHAHLLSFAMRGIVFGPQIAFPPHRLFPSSQRVGRACALLTLIKSTLRLMSPHRPFADFFAPPATAPAASATA